MPRNVEIKASVADLHSFHSRCYKVAGDHVTNLQQRDIFFKMSDGKRLKLRFSGTGPDAHLIFYERPNQEGPKLSRFHTTKLNDGSKLENILELALGKVGEVRKERWLYLSGQTRIHCDAVEGLGSFVELEVCLRDEQTPEEGVEIAEDLMQRLDIKKEDLVTNAYMDMLLAKQQ